MALEPELTVVTRLRNTLQQQKLCCLCLRVLSVSTPVCLCGGAEFVRYLDQRPLLLDSNATQAAMALLDEILERANDSATTLDELQWITTEYLPWLTRVIQDSEVAKRRQVSGGSGFRTATVSTEEIINALREQRYPT